jgi:hypothetical protein
VSNPNTCPLDGVFLGSFVTDGNGDIIPFVRAGNDVFLEPNAEPANTMYYTPLYTFGSTLPASSPSNPQTTQIGFAQVPRSATAMIVDFEIQPITTAGYLSVFFLSPQSTTVAPGCTSVSMHDFIYDPTPTQGYFLHQLRVPMTSAGQLTVGSCSIPTGGATLGTTLVGYVENVNAPGVSFQPQQ